MNYDRTNMRKDEWEAEVDGVLYKAVETSTGEISCIGCVADYSRSLCFKMPACSESGRSDGKNVIWLEAQPKQQEESKMESKMELKVGGSYETEDGCAVRVFTTDLKYETPCVVGITLHDGSEYVTRAYLSGATICGKKIVEAPDPRLKLRKGQLIWVRNEGKAQWVACTFAALANHGDGVHAFLTGEAGGNLVHWDCWKTIKPEEI